MHKLRVFVFDVLGGGLVVGWLIWKYPETIDTIIPWILLLITWHLIWETVLQVEAVKVRLHRLLNL